MLKGWLLGLGSNRDVKQLTLLSDWNIKQLLTAELPTPDDHINAQHKEYYTKTKN